MHSKWVNSTEELGLQPSDHFYAWLSKPKVLSEALRMLCQQLSVQVISQQLGSATLEEQQLLNIAENNSLIREVYLCGDGAPWVQARVIVPYAVYKVYRSELDNLGSKLFGEAFMYNKHNLSRNNCEFNLSTNGIYSRRTLFSLQLDRILVCETFLPAIPSYNEI